jgi:aspartate aminotransferase/aminotransferase
VDRQDGGRELPRGIAKRMAGVRASGIRRMFELAQSIEDPINLSIGQPDFEVPEDVQAAAIRAIKAGENRYTVTQGLPELNRRILGLVAERFSLRAESSLVTAGVSGGLTLALLVLVDPGDEVLIPDPYFLMYKNLASLCGGVPKTYDLYPDFRLRPERIEAAITPRTKVLVLNSPSNPTGTTATRDELGAIAEIAGSRGLFVVSDEIYDGFVYDDRHRSIAEHLDSVILLSGFSKTYAMPGWRLGYAVGPRDVLDEMRTLQQFTFVCAPSFAQRAALAALDEDIAPRVEEYRHKRRLLVEGLSPHYRFTPPQGAFYAFIEAPEGTTGSGFAERALEHRVLVVPGNSCSERNTHFRVSFAVPDDVLRRGIEILSRLAH